MRKYRKELSVDLYELTMSQVFWRRGMDKTATFSLFFRGYPKDRGYYVANGIEAAIDFLEGFRFSSDDIASLSRTTHLSADFVDYLAAIRFTGSARAVEEGTIVFADEPLFEVTAPIIEAQIVETMLLNIVTSASLFATKATRIIRAAEGRHVVDFGSRRTHSEESAIEAARAGYIAGFAGTSNLKASARYGIPAVGTMAHSYIQVFGDEHSAFDAYAAEFPEATTLLVDTFDTLDGVRNAIRVAQIAAKHGRSVHAIRLDSGNLGRLAKVARTMLDDNGFTEINIIASGGLDEHSIHDLVAAGAPIDAFGVGTRFGTSADAPYIDSVYKLVELDGEPIIKRSEGKQTLPYAKQVCRTTRHGDMLSDLIVRHPSSVPQNHDVHLLHPAMERGERLRPSDSIEQIRSRVAANFETLSEKYRSLSNPAMFRVEHSPELLSMI